MQSPDLNYRPDWGVSSKEIYKRPTAANANPEPKVQVELGSIEDRDLVMGHAVNLNNNATMEIVVPDRLKLVAGRLENYAFRYRTQAKELAKGKKEMEAKTQIRFDNTKEGLVLGIRSKSDKWKFYTPENLPKLPYDQADSAEGIVCPDDD